MPKSGPNRAEYENLKTKLANLEEELSEARKLLDVTFKKPLLKTAEPPKMTSTRQSLEIVLSTISAYLRVLEKKKRGALSKFAKNHEILTYWLTRLKNRKPNDSYEPTAGVILTVIQAILNDPRRELVMEGATTETFKEDFPGMEQNILTIFYVANIISNRELLDQDLIEIFLMMLAALNRKAILVNDYNTGHLERFK